MGSFPEALHDSNRSAEFLFAENTFLPRCCPLTPRAGVGSPGGQAEPSGYSCNRWPLRVSPFCHGVYQYLQLYNFTLLCLTIGLQASHRAEFGPVLAIA